MKRPLQLPLAIALALAGGNALALGLGPVQVKSRLNQPLDAEIPVIEASPGEAEGLLVSLANAEDFARIGISRSGVSVPLEFTLVQGSGGQAVIRVTSQEPVRQSYLDFLVEANWPNGRLLREYTILLDPPLTAPARSTAATPAPAPAPAPARSQPLAESAPPERAPAATPTPASPPASAAAPQVSDGRFGPVESGQTLSQVARQVRPGDDLNRVMLALFRANPDAFYKDNINALKRGAILRVPDEQELAAVGSRQEAAEQVRSFWQEWQGTASATRVAAAPATDTARPSRRGRTGDSPASSGERLALVPPRADSGSETAGDRPGSGSGSARSAGNGSQAELARAQEALASREQEAAELKSRVSELEDINTKTERLLSLKDSEIAELQRRLAELQQAAGTAEPERPAVAADAQAPSPAEPVADEPAVEATQADPAVATADDAAADEDAEAPIIALAPDVDDTEAADDAPADTGDVTGQEPWGQPAADEAPAEALALDEEAPATEAAPAVEPAAEAESPAQVVSPTPAPASAEPWYEKPWVKPAALGGGLLVLLGGLLGLRRKRPAHAARSSSLADSFADGPLGKAPDAASEAEKLRAELAGDPQNVGLHLELLSVYYAEGDVARFEDQAAAMHACVDDPNQPEWLEARAMGQELAPDNPLFSEPAAVPADAAGEAFLGDAPAFDDEAALASEDTFDFDHAEPAPPPAPAPAADPADSFDWQDSPSAAGEDVSGFGLLGEAPEDADDSADPFAGIDPLPEAPPTAIDDAAGAPGAGIEPPREVPPVESGLDVGELAPLEWESAAPGQDAPAAGLSDELDAGLDFEPAADIAPPAAPDAEEGDEADAAAAAGFDLYGEDAVATKLDLARAYLDMGDPDGARSMLEEVLSEGNEGQREEAQKLLDDID